MQYKTDNFTARSERNKNKKSIRASGRGRKKHISDFFLSFFSIFINVFFVLDMIPGMDYVRFSLSTTFLLTDFQCAASKPRALL